MRKYINECTKNRITTDGNFRLLHTARRRSHHALNGYFKSSFTNTFYVYIMILIESRLSINLHRITAGCISRFIMLDLILHLTNPIFEQ